MFFLYLEIAMLVLAVVAVGACSLQLFIEDRGIQQWISTKHDELGVWISQMVTDYMNKPLMIRYRHKPRHSPQYIGRQREWYLRSLAFSAT